MSTIRITDTYHAGGDSSGTYFHFDKRDVQMSDDPAEGRLIFVYKNGERLQVRVWGHPNGGRGSGHGRCEPERCGFFREGDCLEYRHEVVGQAPPPPPHHGGGFGGGSHHHHHHHQQQHTHQQQQYQAPPQQYQAPPQQYGSGFGGGIVGDNTGCIDCYGCTGCTGCVGCTDCHDCTGCHGCVGLTGAVGANGQIAPGYVPQGQQQYQAPPQQYQAPPQRYGSGFGGGDGIRVTDTYHAGGDSSGTYFHFDKRDVQMSDDPAEGRLIFVYKNGERLQVRVWGHPNGGRGSGHGRCEPERCGFFREGDWIEYRHEVA